MPVIINGTTGISGVDGSAGTPSYVGGDSDTGLWYPAANTLALSTSGSERLRIDSSGNVGIGVTPSAWSTTVPALQLGGGGAFLAALGSSPYVALGTNAHYNGTNFVYRTTNTASYYDQSSGLHRWYTAPSGTAGTNVTFTQAMTLDASGNLGIGASSFPADTNLTVLGNFQTGFYRNITSGGRGYFINIGAKTSGGFADGAYVFGAVESGDATGYLTFGTRSGGSTGERMRITSGGYTKMSNTGTYVGSTSDYHEMVGSSNNETVVIRGSSSSLVGNIVYIDANRNTTNNTFYALSYFNNGSGTYKFRVADSGNVTNTNGSYGTISDVKNKENIVDATPKLDKLNQLKVRNFNFIGDDFKQIGFVAQEFEQVFPSMVEEHQDKDDEGNDLGTTTKSIKTSVLVPILVKAIQEQQAMIEELKAEVAALKAK